MNDFNVNQYLKNIAEASKHTQIVRFKMNPVELFDFSDGMPFTLHMSNDGTARAEIDADTIQEAKSIVTQHITVKEWL
jgi:hypothetical protein